MAAHTSSTASAASAKLVVLDLAGRDVLPAYVDYLTTQLRFEALRALPPSWAMVGRPQGDPLALCAADDECAAGAVSAAGADQGIAGVLSTRDDRLRLEVRRVEGRSGRILGRAGVDASNLVGILRDLPQACAVLLDGADRPVLLGVMHGPTLELSELGPAPQIREPAELEPVDLASLEEVGLDALEDLDAVVRFEETSAPPVRKEAQWLGLAARLPVFAEVAQRRANEWRRFRAELDRFEEVQRDRVQARDRDWDRLARFLRLRVVSDDDKIRWSRAFVAAYGGSPPANPHTIDLRHMLANGSLRANRVARLASRDRAPADWAEVPKSRDSRGAPDFLERVTPPERPQPGPRPQRFPAPAEPGSEPPRVHRAHFVINGYIGPR